MSLRNCPICFGLGYTGHTGRCGFCHGKKKVRSEFCLWTNKQTAYARKVHEQLEDEMEAALQDRKAKLLKEWEKKNPKPRKFKKGD